MSPTTIPGNLILQSPTANDPLLDLNTQPSLDLQFATSKTLDDRVSGQNLITFSRSTTGTYVDSNGIIQTAAIDAPRFDHDPSTGESLGLLIEEARTNLVPNSETFSDWSTFTTTKQSNAGTSPSGSNDALKIVADAVSGGKLFYRNLTTAASNVVSIYAKAGEYTNIQIRELSLARFYVNFDLSSGTYVAPQPQSGSAGGPDFVSADIQEVGNGWYRCSVVNSRVGALTFCVSGYPDSVTVTTNPPNFVGDGTSGVYVWGPQVEEGSFPTSYIPTSGSTVTRAADVAEITGTNFSRWYEQSEGTVFASFDSAGGSPSRAAYGLGSVVASQGTNTSSDPAKFSWYDGSSNIQTANEVDFTTAARKTAASFTDTEVSICLEGGAVVTGTQSSVTETKIHLGARQAGVSKFLNGHIKRLTYYPYRLPDATLQEITS